MTKEFIEFQSVINENSKITDVEVRDNKTYFRIDGYLFQTVGYKILHENHPLFDHVVTNIYAKENNTAEGIKEREDFSEKINKEIDLFYKHKVAFYKLIFLKALEYSNKSGDEMFVKFVDDHIDITPEEKGQKLLEILDKHE